MSAPDPDSYSLLAKVLAAGAAIIAPVGGLFIWIDGRYAKSHAVKNQLQAVFSELGTLRKQIEENEHNGEARHRELLMHLLDNKK
ncbi:MAG TPA: hypothetical protein VFA81_06560 [Burkholderiales bacterium]|nr:hypothetical protein [Burkholderiales bacterium]